MYFAVVREGILKVFGLIVGLLGIMMESFLLVPQGAHVVSGVLLGSFGSSSWCVLGGHFAGDHIHV